MVQNFDFVKLTPIYKTTRCQNQDYCNLKRYKFNSIFFEISQNYTDISQERIATVFRVEK